MELKTSLVRIAILGGCLWAGAANAAADTKDLLIKFTDTTAVTHFALMAQTGGAKIENLGTSNWVRVQLTDKQLQHLSLDDIRRNPNVLDVQPNYKLKLLNDYKIEDPVVREKAIKELMARKETLAAKDNPAIPGTGNGGSGPDPLANKQWGMNDIGAKAGQKDARGEGVIVAVIDTGVDYTHEDLIDNMWRNQGETGKDAQGRDKATNGVDDDGNGYIDDTIGWDFVTNDNKPFDLSAGVISMIIAGGNPGHGTHCAGNVAAVAGNGKGVSGVAPGAKIMALRFLSEKGQGDTAGAIKAIDYAVRNGAKVLSNSWGSEGEDANAPENKALKESIAAAERAGVLFIAAAGNGHSGMGYDNDTDSAPGYPASYDHENIISVAALDSKDRLASFSNWGLRSVDIGAPGVKVFSTTVGSKYSDTVLNILGVIKATWDGTSMAAPHVSGAAALYWSKHPNATWREVKDAIMTSARPIDSMRGKSVTGGKLNVESLMQR